MKEKILKQFDETKGLYSLFGEKCKAIIDDILRDKSIIIHQINSRTKTKESLGRKIDSKKDKYADINEITDICGIRIITYLESDVNRVAEIIEKEFKPDYPNSVDKRKLKADQFGYKSLHYVISLNDERLNLSENKKYNGLKIEVQIRSILQHAWAEIEHDLGYKGTISIPEDFKRSFNRLAALLETADVEFDRLKRDLTDYEIAVKDKIKKEPNQVKIDQASLHSFITTNKIFEKARGVIAEATKCEFSKISNLTLELERLEFFKIQTIGELENIIEQNQKHYLAFVKEFIIGLDEKKLNMDLPLFYFLHFLACKPCDEAYLNNYFTYGTMALGGEMTARDFIDVFKKSA